jgi:hypothetical protein
MGLVAIATSDGVTIDGRLDTPGTFQIYHFNDCWAYSLVELRSLPGHPGCRHQLMVSQAALLLADVHLVLVTCLPQPTEQFLLSRGIMAIAVRGRVREALEAYRHRGWLLDELITVFRRRLKTDDRSNGQLHREF